MTDEISLRTQPVPACLLCGGPGEMMHDSLRDRLFGTPGSWSFRKCVRPTCGLLWLDPAPLEADLWKAYGSYYTHHATGQERPRSMKALIGRNLIRCLNVLLLPFGLRRKRFLASTMYLAGMRPGRVLEVGCGSGAVLQRLRRLGWEVHGLDPDARAVKVARDTLGANVRQGLLEQSDYEAQSFDAVLLNHVIEHVHDPVTLIAQCRRVLKPGGCLVVVTPNADGLGHARFGRNWRGLEPPRHLHLFSMSTLGDIARRAGFEITEVWTSAANAESIFLSSTSLANNCRPGPDSSAGLMTTVRSFLFQARELIAVVRQRHSGEEIVLKAFR